MPGVLGSSGRLFPHFGLNFEPLPYADHPTRDANDDWLFGAPVPTAINDPYAGDEGGCLITEHPNNIGTPKPAMFTPYSLGALVFATSFIWLSADLRARDGSGSHVSIGWALTAVVSIVNIAWFYRAWKQFKLTRLIEICPLHPFAALRLAKLKWSSPPSAAGTTSTIDSEICPSTLPFDRSALSPIEPS